MEFNKIFSGAIVTKQPRIVIEGISLPSLLNKEGFSIRVNGLLGSGSEGVPSTRLQHPICEFRPTVKRYIGIFTIHV